MSKDDPDPRDNRRDHSRGLIGRVHEQTAHQLLWRAVMAQAVVDVYGAQYHRNQVIEWLGTRDFETVCDHANIEPDQMRKQIAYLCRLPYPLAKKYGKQLRDAIMQGIHTENSGQFGHKKTPDGG